MLFLVALIDIARPGTAIRIAHLISRVLGTAVMMIWVIINGIFSILIHYLGDTGAGIAIILFAVWFFWLRKK
jgi:hypothetical protein